jgi:hypothetical protein
MTKTQPNDDYDGYKITDKGLPVSEPGGLFSTQNVAFLTGSQVYGTPKSESDIDLVIVTTPEVAAFLREHSEESHKFAFGKLNLIVCTTDSQYKSWQEGTKELLLEKEMMRSPIERDHAVEVFDRWREKLGVITNYDTE